MNPPEPSAELPVIDMRAVAFGSLYDPETPVLEGVDWKASAGDYWAVAGMHGSGKSDLLSCAAGLLPPLAGQYRFFGQDMPLYEDKLLGERLRLGFVFDGGRLFQHLTIAENVALPLRYHRGPEEAEAGGRVSELLEQLQLAPWANSRPGALGRNWQRRAALARALALEPEVLLLDNPLGGLDPRHTNWWLGFLDKLATGQGRRDGRPMTLVVTVEDLRPWRNRATHFAILQNRKFTVLGLRPVLAGHTETLVRELLAEDSPGI